MAEPMTTVEYSTAVLEWIKLGVTTAVSAELAASLTADILRDEIAGQIVHRITAHVLADQLPPEHVERSAIATFSAPASWWQAWKAEHPRIWGGWLARRWPARMTEHVRTATMSVDLRRYWAYPEQRVTMPQLGRPVRVATYDTSVRWAP